MHLAQAQPMGDESFDLKKSRFKNLHDLWKGRALNERTQNRDFVPRHSVLIHLSIGMLVHAKQDDATAAADQIDSFRKQAASRINHDIGANAGDRFHLNGNVTGLGIESIIDTELLGHSTPELYRLHNHDL